MQSLVESGHLAGARGAYRLTTPVEALQVPATVQAVLAARIDRLPEREKQVLQTAAVIGKTFGEALLRRVARRASRRSTRRRSARRSRRWSRPSSCTRRRSIQRSSTPSSTR